MNPFKLVLASRTSQTEAARTSARRAPTCESLEGRQLMSADLGAAGWMGAAHAGAGGAPPAHVHVFGKAGGASAHAGGKLGGLRHGPGSKSLPQPSAQVQADFKKLEADQQALLAEAPAGLTASIKADQAVIEQAFQANSPKLPRGGMKIHGNFTPPTQGADPTTHLADMLKAANVPSAQADQIVVDFTTYQTTLKTLDPALQATITADQAALTTDLGGHAPKGMSFGAIGSDLGFGPRS